MKKPHIINFRQIGESGIGYISVAEMSKDIPFEIRRVFWTYFTPQSVTRGRHAHHQTEQVLVAAAGKIIVSTEDVSGGKAEFVLDSPTMGLYLPPNCWHVMQYSHNAVQLALASTPFEEKDYIRDYEEFKKLK